MTDTSIFQFPLSILLAAVLVTGIMLSDQRLRSKPVYDFITGRWTAATGLLTLSIFLVIEGTWGNAMHHHPLFLSIMGVFIYTTGCTALRSFRERRSWGHRLSHLGMFITLLGGYFTGADVRDGVMKVCGTSEEHYAYSSTGHMIPLPFSVSLHDLEIEYYDGTSSPRQYRSHLLIDGDIMTTEVNSPCRYHGYLIYQSGCDMDDLSYTVLKVVRDPWLPVTFAGMAILVISAIISLGSTWKGKWSWVAIITATIAFTLISVAKINFGTLMPALRSMWFVPHLIIYMTAYSMLAISVISGILHLFRPCWSQLYPISSPLLRTSSSLMLIGMICGAVWAKYAWGDYWAWDAKECWAAVTWFLTLVGTHIGANGNTSKRLTVAIAILAFAAMQITWYGVNYLPSAERSLHTYNQ